MGITDILKQIPKVESQKLGEDLIQAADQFLGKDLSLEKTEVKIQAQVKSKGEETVIRDEKVVVEENFFEKNPPRVWMDYSVTKNLGNYESLKFNVGISVPVGQPVSEEVTKAIEETYKYASTKIGQVIEKELADTVEMLRGKS